MKFIQRFRIILMHVRNTGVDFINPFANYKFNYEKVDRGYLEQNEIIPFRSFFEYCFRIIRIYLFNELIFCKVISGQDRTKITLFCPTFDYTFLTLFIHNFKGY